MRLFLLFLFLFAYSIFASTTLHAQTPSSGNSSFVKGATDTVGQFFESAAMFDGIAERISSRMNKMAFTEVQTSIIGAQYERMLSDLDDARQDINGLQEDVQTFQAGVSSQSERKQFKTKALRVVETLSEILASQKLLVSELKQIQEDATSAGSMTLPLEETITPTVQP